jgi:hypothetical protein
MDCIVNPQKRLEPPLAFDTLLVRQLRIVLGLEVVDPIVIRAIRGLGMAHVDFGEEFLAPLSCSTLLRFKIRT